MEQFDTRYKSPSMRARDEKSMPDENPMENPADAAPQPAGEKASGFASVEVFGGETPKPGQKFTIEIKDVDPDSREAEFVIVDEAAPEPTEQPAATPAAPAEQESPMAEPT
jgi:hypothetical protein